MTEFFSTTKRCSLSSLVKIGSASNTADAHFTGISFIDSPISGYLTFCDKKRSCVTENANIRPVVLISPDLADWLASMWPIALLLVVDDPRAAFIDAVESLQRSDLLRHSSLLPSSTKISDHARIASTAVIEAGAQIDADVTIGGGTVIHAGTWVKTGSTISDNCVVGTPGINVYIGQDGCRRSLPHVAGVIIGENTNIGAGCIVARGIFTSTKIGSRCIIGNLCNVGHGTELGDNIWMSTGTCIAGLTHIGSGTTIAMGCSIRDNISIGACAHVGMGSVVTKSVGAGSSVFGNPARTVRTIKAGPSR